MLTHIDLFAGIGGFTMAAYQNGFETIFVCEKDKFACQTYQANFQSPNPLPNDITQLESIPTCDLLTFGSPCQNLSFAGNRKGLEGEKSILFYEAVRLLKQSQPKTFLMENVVMTQNNKDIILKELQSCGYVVFNEILNSKDFGVPQNRKRNFWMGIRKDLGKVFFSFPHYHIQTKLKDILESNVDPKYTLSDRYLTSLKARQERHSKKGNGFTYDPIDINGIANTLHVGGSSIESNLIKQDNIRRLTPRECFRLQGYPDTYMFVCSDSQLYKQIGNSITIPLVSAIIKEIRKQLLGDVN